MKILTEYYPSLIKLIKITPFFIVFFLLMGSAYQLAYGQHSKDLVIKTSFLSPHFSDSYSSFSSFKDTSSASNYPNPKVALKRSLILPGWGQVTNKQTWKVPIIYGLIGGLTYYSVYLHKRYHDYRAAYYNVIQGSSSDFRFGSTPSYINTNVNSSALKSTRNFYRNRRDFIYIAIALSYGLNAIDAYVYAHLRSFDVSDDLSFNTTIKPDLIFQNTMIDPVPSLTFTFALKTQ